MHFVSLLVSAYLVRPLWGASLEQNILAITLGYFVFLNAFTIFTGLLRIILQPKLKVGKHLVGLHKEYLAYVINSTTHGIFLSSPFHKQCTFILYLKWIHFRLMGMKLPYSSIVSVESMIRQPELIEVGKNSILGLGCIISCHYSPSKKYHVQEKVIIGDRTIIGGFAKIAPGVEVGNDSVVGADNNVYPGVKIGSNVKIGGDCILSFGVKIPDNVKIKSQSLLTKDCDIKEGETWGGNPAVKVSEA